MKGIARLFNTKYGGLIFSLFCGGAYYIIILDFLIRYTQNGGGLLGFFFFPAIICGGALVLFKTAKRLTDAEQYAKLNALIYIHLLLIAVSLVFLADIFKN